MIKVEKNGIYTPYVIRSGESEKGKWMMAIVRDETGHAALTLWIRNQEEIKLLEKQQFKVVDILACSVQNRKQKNKDANGKDVWEKVCNADVIIEPIASEFDDVDWDNISDEDLDNIPF